MRTFLRTIFDRGYKSSFLSGVVNCGGFRIPDVSLRKKWKYLNLGTSIFGSAYQEIFLLYCAFGIYIRKERGIRQEDFAKAMGVSRQTISSLENGRYNPSILLAYKIARYFEMTIEEVFLFEEEDLK